MSDTESFQSFCQTETFRSYVRSAINNNSFLDIILEDYRLNSIISSKLDDKLPQKVKEQLRIQLPDMVTSNIVKQLPSILNNDVTMQNILATHRDKLNIAISNSAKQIIENITNDPEYHEVNKKYFNAFENRGTASIRSFEQKNNATILQLKNECDRVTKELKTKLDQNDKLEERINELETDIKSIGRGLAYTIGIGIIGAGGYLISRL